MLLKRIKRYIKARKHERRNFESAFRNQVREEYEAFQQQMMEEEKEDIYEAADQIRFYREMKDYLLSEGVLENLDPAVLSCPTPLAVLFDIYQSTDELGADTEEWWFELISIFEEEYGVAA